MTNAINWTQAQLRLFMRMYRYMSANQDKFMRNETPRMSKLDWGTISRLAALYAAHNMVEGPTGETKPADLGEI